MSITSTVGYDGSARITLDGHEVKLREPSIDSARARVLEHARNYAAGTGTVQRLSASDPKGHWEMFVYPSGEVVPAPPRNAEQDAPQHPIMAPTPLQAVESPTPRYEAAVPPSMPSTFVRPAPMVTVPSQRVAAEPAAEPTMAAAEHDDHEETVLIQRAPRRSITVRVDTGETTTVMLPAVLGRRPSQRGGYSVVALLSPGREVSRTHAVVDVDDQGRLVVIDQDSANGSYINGKAVAPGVPTVLDDDAHLELGDVTIRIENAPTAAPRRSHHGDSRTD
jgi:hypothetical protein